MDDDLTRELIQQAADDAAKAAAEHAAQDAADRAAEQHKAVAERAAQDAADRAAEQNKVVAERAAQGAADRAAEQNKAEAERAEHKKSESATDETAWKGGSDHGTTAVNYIDDQRAQQEAQEVVDQLAELQETQAAEDLDAQQLEQDEADQRAQQEAQGVVDQLAELVAQDEDNDSRVRLTHDQDDRMQLEDEQIFLEEAREAWARPFSETAQLARVWNAAAKGKKNFKSARRAFWRRVNNPRDKDAEYVARMVRAAGYETMTRDRAPVLDQGIVWRSKEPEHEQKLKSDRILSLDHLNPQSNSKQVALNAKNIRFMSMRDNAFRGDRYDKQDKSSG